MSVWGDVRVLYMNNLGRVADPGGLAHYVNQAANGRPYSEIAQEMRNSGEGRNTANVVRNAYRTFLGREPSQQEVDFQVNSGQPAHQLAKNIQRSGEAAVFRQALESAYVKAYPDLQQHVNENRDAYSVDKSIFINFPGDSDYIFAIDHWNTYGKNENRVIPYTGLLQIDPSTGDLALADRKFYSNSAWNNFNNLINRFRSTSGGNYKQLLETSLGTLDAAAKENLLAQNGIKAIETYYQQNKIGDPWDASRYGAQPPVGGFDSNYYASQAPQALDTWNKAVNGIVVRGNRSTLRFNDLDITGRYTYDTYLQQHYTSTGRYAGLRANAAVEPEEAKNYVERLTDAELQVYRDQVLGLDPAGKTVTWEDGQPSLYESEVQQAFEARDAQAQQTFGALTQDVLKQASQKLIEQKRKESNLSLFRGLPGFDEVFSINQTLADSLLGDSGVGGILSIGQNVEETKEGLEKQLSAFTGIPSSNATIYNWQKWFDNELVKRYETMTEVMSPEDATKMLELEQGFAQTFIDEYLKPRFDQSKSMDEFISYIDVKKGEENIFQTQSAITALQDVANVRAKLFYDQIKSATGGGFDANFYFDPTVDQNQVKTDIYQKQKDEVAKDWEDAKNRGDQVKIGQYTWNQWAYYYGLNPNNKEDFARLHYQVKGMGQGFDPAADIVTLDDAKAYINNVVLPAIQEADLDIGDQPFLQFTTPEEFADELLKGISPDENDPQWVEILKMYGLDPTESSLEEVREYIIEAVRTNQAKDIRESIKYLNEKKLTPTQAKLGVTYIERPEDKKDITPEDETPLYKIFKEAGYAGNEEDFYKNFMPDTSLEDQQLLARALGGKLEVNPELDASDPFESLATLSSFFPETETTDDGEEKPTTSSYFKLFEDDEAADEKSDAAKSYLSEFTSLFKGFD